MTSISPASSPQSPKSFEWSLKSYIIWMKWITGIEINSGKKPCGLFLIYGTFLLMANVIANVFYIWSYADNNRLLAANSNCINFTVSIKSSSCNASFNIVGMLMDSQTNLLMIFGVHCCFYVISFSLITPVWCHLLRIQEQMDVPFEIYESIKKIVRRGFVLLAADCLIRLALNLVIAGPRNYDIQTTYIILLWLAATCSSSVVILFWIITSTAITLFKLLNSRIRVILSRTAAGSIDGVQELLVWKNHHAMIHGLVLLINRCFGPVVLVSICHGFLAFITTFYQFVSAAERNVAISGVPYLVSFIKQVFFLSIIIVVSYRLQSEGSKFQTIFFNIPGNLTLQAQNVLNTILIQVSQAESKITAMDFFDVNLTLYPSLVGTTLTYVIILLQAT